MIVNLDLEPPRTSESNNTNTNKNKICLNQNCNCPFNSNNIDKHTQHLDDLYDIDDLVIKLHERNIEFKQQLNAIQNQLNGKVRDNEEAILALRTKDQGRILGKIKILRNLKEYLGNPLIERRDAKDYNRNYDYIFFSSQHIRKFQFLDEPYNQELKGKFKELADAKIFQNCKYRCPRHQEEQIIAFNLQEHVSAQDRLYCKYDDVQMATSFKKCQEYLDNYSKQEEQFQKLQEIKNSIFFLRFNLDCITNKILTLVQSLIEQYHQYFQSNQKEFDIKYQFKPQIPMTTYQNIAQFLAQIQENMTFSSSVQQEIKNCEELLKPLKNQVINIQNKYSNFLSNLKPSKLKIIVELIDNYKVDGYHLEAEQDSTLEDLFKWLKLQLYWNYELSQLTVYIDNIRNTDLHTQAKYFTFKNLQCIQFQLPQKNLL